MPKKPSKEARDAAEYMLAIPNMIGQMAQLLGQQAQMLEDMNTKLEQLIVSLKSSEIGPLVPIQPPPPPEPRVFFLNEAHTTHVTKYQARKEREALKKARLAQVKDPVPTAPGRRPRPSSPPPG